MHNTNKSPKIAIIGGGIAGISTAWYLSKYYHPNKITLIDRQDDAGKECSFANGGQISVCNAEAWHQSKYLVAGLKSLFKSDSPINLYPQKLSFTKLNWLYHFLRVYFQQQSLPITRQLIEYGLQNRQLLLELQQELSLDFDYQKNGIIHIYHTKRAFEVAKNKCRQLADSGWNRYPVSKRELEELEPNLNTDTILGATYSPDDASGDIYKFIQGIVRHLQNNHLLRCQYNTLVTEVKQHHHQWAIQTKNVQQQSHLPFLHELAPQNSLPDIQDLEQQLFDIVIICAGIETSPLVQKINTSANTKHPNTEHQTKHSKSPNIYPIKGYSITVDIPQEKKETPKHAILDDHYKIATSILGERYRVAGFAEWTHQDDINPKRINTLKQWLVNHYPETFSHLLNTDSEIDSEAGSESEQLNAWRCFRPVSPQMKPVIQQQQPGLYINSGGAHLGWTTCLVTGKKTAQLITQNIITQNRNPLH